MSILESLSKVIFFQILIAFPTIIFTIGIFFTYVLFKNFCTSINFCSPQNLMDLFSLMGIVLIGVVISINAFYSILNRKKLSKAEIVFHNTLPLFLIAMIGSFTILYLALL
jgi:hypothetical protein